MRTAAGKQLYTSSTSAAAGAMPTRSASRRPAIAKPGQRAMCRALGERQHVIGFGDRREGRPSALPARLAPALRRPHRGSARRPGRRSIATSATSYTEREHRIADSAVAISSAVRGSGLQATGFDAATRLYDAHSAPSSARCAASRVPSA